MCLMFLVVINKTVISNKSFLSQILLFQLSPDCPSKYNSFMNCVFRYTYLISFQSNDYWLVIISAQKLQVVIDAMVFGAEDSSFMQQACFHTGGCYQRLDHDSQKSKTLQLLLMHALPNRHMREVIRMPQVEQVHFKALCACHGKLQSEALMCSVCLSISCQVSQVCQVLYYYLTIKYPI